MATEPQSTAQAPVNTSLRETSVWSIYAYPNIWEGVRVEKQASELTNQVNLPTKGQQNYWLSHGHNTCLIKQCQIAE